jgi:hypothetical protein
MQLSITEVQKVHDCIFATFLVRTSQSICMPAIMQKFGVKLHMLTSGFIQINFLISIYSILRFKNNLFFGLVLNFVNRFLSYILSINHDKDCIWLFMFPVWTQQARQDQIKKDFTPKFEFYLYNDAGTWLFS